MKKKYSVPTLIDTGLKADAAIMSASGDQGMNGEIGDKQIEDDPFHNPGNGGNSKSSDLGKGDIEDFWKD